jgi:aminoglycoside phosphotransferase family enzyme/predicted kinase
MRRMSQACGPPTELSASAQARMVASLQKSLRATHGDDAVELIETHISFVLLTPAVAYKIKKAVNLGFVDFTSLERRHFFCQEELRLNRRTAPALYLDVLPVTGTPEQPVLGGNGAPIDWALCMRAFAQAGLWDRLAARGALGAAHVDALVEELCALHRGAAVAAADDPAGQAAQVRAPMSDNLRALDVLCKDAGERERLARLGQWEASAFEALRERFDERARQGWVRECHGDLHLGNVTLVDGRSTLFDCLEFSPALRWSDVMSDVAFMAMDLQAHGLARLAQRFVNGVVERSGDAGGLRVLRYYRVHRALVRAKVAALRAAQLDAAASPAQRAEAVDALRHYLDVALACSQHAPPVLMLTHGLSGSGKTLLTQSLLELCGAMRFRADVERKRLFGLDALARGDAAARARLYSSQATEATQARLRELAALALGSGYSVILDATFMARAQREHARALADALRVRFVIIDFQASPDTLRERVRQRTLRADDASDADLLVLEDQLAHAQPLHAQEQSAVFAFDAEPAFDEQCVAARWAPLLHRLGITPA